LIRRCLDGSYFLVWVGLMVCDDHANIFGT
jgi:hypothetical protein